ncbi:MAG: hypothetical protein D9V47_08850 [Clostridia bacterium]|nr:MAG: hypothetical protein D9V47_08850 [Clostridia bacterium]
MLDDHSPPGEKILPPPDTTEKYSTFLLIIHQVRATGRNQRNSRRPRPPAAAGGPGPGAGPVFGILAKEVVVGTLGVVYGVGEETLPEVIGQHFTPLSAYAFMVMTLVYIPCVAATGAIRRKTNSWKWTALAIGYSLVLGWLQAVIIYQGGRLLGLG